MVIHLHKHNILNPFRVSVLQIFREITKLWQLMYWSLPPFLDSALTSLLFPRMKGFMESRILLDSSQNNSGESPITPINSFYSFFSQPFPGWSGRKSSQGYHPGSWGYYFFSKWLSMEGNFQSHFSFINLPQPEFALKFPFPAVTLSSHE